ncbi:hypothetical protein [Vibrio parahaemolyticus]|uniref:hypothetical protein n=2 Tax=Vibrio parahaemolyticus TaxID=670 RepID=UPI00111DC321|nr:hypothetical protein [Vibrio parahaemolyticus]MDL2044659.1 hypothetical protein [Vibrio parahaemolyticus]TOL08718.1 hypothetical protein CGI05_23225 [Vibrio parahaemolyticus]TOO91806.1 hypothetical protein CGH25_23770 [Vibrio parahaemolyticus]TOQ72438.1 hypothetical protein CGG89_08045 [Vibrio parahaemolyticus]
MSWKKDFWFTVGVFAYSSVIFAIQIFMFSDLEKLQASKEHLYSYQMERWQYSSSLRWDDLLKYLNASGRVLCDTSGGVTQEDMRHLKTYYRDMFSIMMLSKSKFSVSSYMFDEIDNMIKTIDSNLFYQIIAGYFISDTDLEEFSKLSKQYRLAIEESAKLEKSVLKINEELDANNSYINKEIVFKSTCNKTTPFFNEKSMSVINELNKTTIAMLGNYSLLNDVYSNVANVGLAFKKLFMFLLFLRLQWLIMLKAIEAIKVERADET